MISKTAVLLAVSIFSSPGFILPANATESVTHQYSVTLYNDMTGLSVKACFSGSQPEKLLNYSDSSKNYLKFAMVLTAENDKKNLKANRRSIPLPPLLASDCVQYEVNFRGDTTFPWFKNQQANHDQVLVDIHSWLWFPANFDSQKHAIGINFNLPQGISISAPWKKIKQTKLNNRQHITYRYSLRPAQWAGSIAIGRFKTETIKKGDSIIELAILNAKKTFNAKSLMPWVYKNLDALLMTYGQFPVDKLQLLIVPIGKGKEPVPWGEAMHGGGDAVHLYIDQTRPIEEFMQDWVLIHELSHLLHPRFNNATWLGEGIASYYQNVLRSRSGLLSKQKAWQKLHEGFQRGIKDTATDKTLAQVSATMMKTKSFMRVYWSGAAISLLADYELRRQSNNKQSLDSVMKKFNQCCLRFNRKWSSNEIMYKLDSLSNTQVFSRLHDRYLHSTKFPELATLYNKLGLSVKNDHIQLDPQASHISVREAIMQNIQ